MLAGEGALPSCCNQRLVKTVVLLTVQCERVVVSNWIQRGDAGLCVGEILFVERALPVC